MLVAVVSGHGQAVMYKSYVFDAWGTAVPTPEPYMPVKTVYGNDLGIGNFRNAQDLFVAPDGTLYIVDTGNNRIVATDADFNVLAVHDRFEFAGETHTFKNPKGVFVTDDGQMFVADTLNLRVVHFDSQGNCVGIISDPEKDNTELFPDYFRFRPNKIAVDQAGRMYVTVEGLYEGIMVLDLDGRFRGFVGAPKVRIGFWDYFWRRIASDEQRKRMRHLLPTEYSSMYLDQQGFILTIVSGGDVNVDQLIRRLSPAGVDVLRRDGLHPPMGDLYTGYRSQISGYSQLVDIIGRDNDVYSVLDQRRGRVFTYDRDGNLLYVFGGTGQGEGLFVNPAALEELGSGNMVVLDASNNSITVFAPTEYAVMIHAALDHYEHGRYDQAAEMWQQVNRLNANYELAYSGVAAAHLRQGDYQTAMQYYKLGNNRSGYSYAFYRYRRQVVGGNFGLVMTTVVCCAVIWYLGSKMKLRPRIRKWWSESRVGVFLAGERVQANPVYRFLSETWAGLKYSKHVIFHPFDGFWNLKQAVEGNAAAATIILIGTILTFVFMRQYTGFIFNFNKTEEVNVAVEMISVALPFLLWCVVNWGFTTLMDGKGTIKDIYIASAYALAPIIMINIPATIASNFMTADEGTFYYLLVAVSTIWAVGLLFFDVIDRILFTIQELYLEISYRM